MDICHLKNSELEPKFQKYKGRVVLRGDMVKDESGFYAVFTEQGSSASQMTAAKVMDVAGRLADCAGQAGRRSVSVHPGQNGGRFVIVETSKVRMSRYLDTSTETQMAEIMVILQAGLFWERQSGKRMGKSSDFGNADSSTERKDYSCLCLWTISKWQERNNIWTQRGGYLWKTFIWENQHHSLTIFICVLLKNVEKQRYCGQQQEFVWIQDVSWRGAEKLHHSEKSEADISSWSYDMEGHAMKCVQTCCELANKTTPQLHRVTTPWKTQSFLLNGICTVIFWQDCCGKGNSRKFYWNTVGTRFKIGNAYL